MFQYGELTVKELFQKVETKWKSTPTEYPQLYGLSEIEERDYVIRHVISHITKSLGRLAEEVERVEHSELGIDHIHPNKIGIEACKLMICATKLATLIEISADEFVVGIEHVLEKK